MADPRTRSKRPSAAAAEAQEPEDTVAVGDEGPGEGDAPVDVEEKLEREGPGEDEAASEAEQPVGDMAEADPRYTVEELRASARGWLGCSPHAAAGALSKETDRTWTVAEAKAAVEEFLNREYPA